MRLVRLAGLLVCLGVAAGISSSRDVPIGFGATVISSMGACSMLIKLLLDAGVRVLVIVVGTQFVSVLMVACLLGALLQVLYRILVLNLRDILI